MVWLGGGSEKWTETPSNVSTAILLGVRLSNKINLLTHALETSFDIIDMHARA